MISEQVLHYARLLELGARQKSDKATRGNFLSAFRGEGLDFRDVRAYVPGDDVRHIDWKVTARAGLPQIKTFNEDRNINIVIAVDVSASMDFGSGERSKQELAQETAALLLAMGNLNGYKMHLVAFSDDVHMYLPLRNAEAEVIKALTRLVNLKVDSAGATDYDALAHFVGSVIRKRGSLFLLSDFIGLTETWPLQQLRRRFRLNLFQFYDRLEVQGFAKTGSARLQFVDAESGQQRFLRAGQQPHLWRSIEEQFPVEGLPLLVNDFSLSQIVGYFKKRQRMISR